jgi:hypothetical protein
MKELCLRAMRPEIMPHRSLLMVTGSIAPTRNNIIFSCRVKAGGIQPRQQILLSPPALTAGLSRNKPDLFRPISMKELCLRAMRPEIMSHRSPVMITGCIAPTRKLYFA